METAAIVIGTMAAAAVAVIKAQDMKAKRKHEERKAEALVEVEERIERNRRIRENSKPKRLDRWQTEFLDKMIKYMRKKEQEQKQLRKWHHYATHAKKRRIRKKYRNKLRKYYASKPVIPGGNWHYGSGAGLFSAKIGFAPTRRWPI